MLRLNAVARYLWDRRPLAYRVLDRGALRGPLGRAATAAARRETVADVEIVFSDGLWLYRVGDDYFPGEDRFVYRHGDDLARLPAYESDLTNDLWFHVYRPRPGDVIIDGGAGIGGETQVFSRAVGPEGRVISIEASPSTFARLEARVRRNRLGNVTPCHCALVDGARPVYVEDRREVYERNTVGLDRRPGDLDVSVEGTSLDELCARHGVEQIAFLKLNIEGAEALAIEGMHRMIDRTNAVCIACHRSSEYGADTSIPIKAFLRNAGFELVTRQDDERPFVRDHVHAIRRP